MKLSVSVIVPSFNCGQYIAQALASVYGQTLLPDQVIVVDDGSTDNTAEIVRRFGEQHSSLQYIFQDNSGVSVARNTGLSAATAEFVAFLDADDIWFPTMLEKQVALLQTNDNIVCAFSNFIRFDQRTGRDLGDQFHCYEELPTLRKLAGPMPGTFVLDCDAFSTLVSFVEIPGYTQVTMFRRRHIEGLAFNPRLRLCQDMAFALQAFSRGVVAYNEEPLAKVRRHDMNATREFSAMSIDKLRALRAIANVAMTNNQRSAYLDRLIKAHIDAANFCISTGRKFEGVQLYKQCLPLPGSYIRKARGAARLALNLLKA